tara:strand:- start:220 stop:639 length:420 start_codon:yes stop_codon:yes gene_type:complete
LHYRLKVIVESDCNSLLKTFNINLLFEEVEFMSEEIITTIEQQIQDNPILLYMKGSPQAPQCGFSAQTVQCMVSCGQKFAYVDILSNPEIRSALPAYANWPTFPQLWVEGELVGGCDIITEMFESGELETLLDGAANDP